MKTTVATAFVVLSAALTYGQSKQLQSLDMDGWRVEADPQTETITIQQSVLGPLLTDMKLHTGGAATVTPKWHSVNVEADRLLIRTEAPATGWAITVYGNALEISATSDAAFVTALAPSPDSRIPVRTLDEGGAPVIWQGTAEVAHGYGGELTQHRSYLPRKNPEVMYFALGPVSASVFHSLFERRSDTAVDFADDVSLERDRRDPGVLHVKIPIRGNSTLRLRPEYYKKDLGVPYYVPFDDSYFKTAPMVWSSWTSYYEAVTEKDVVRNADWLAEHLKPYGFEYVQLDDGYDRLPDGAHTWIGEWDKTKFPHGPAWLTSYIREKGLRAGLWLVPNAWAGGVKEHPDWYLRTKDGKLILDYNTPTLDSTNPNVLAFEKHLFETLDGWGFDYYKFDGEHAAAKYIPAVDHSKLYNPSADLLANYRHRLEIIRNTLGPERFIEGCPAGTPLNGIGYFNSYFNGDDLYNNWPGMYPLFSSINGNGFLNHLVVYVMPGEGLELGEPMTVQEAEKRRPPVVVETARTRETAVSGFGTTDAEARTLVSYISLTGVAYPLASVMPELPQSRVKLLEATMPTLPILPLDLYSRGTDMTWDKFKQTTPEYYIHNYPETLDLKVNNSLGTYDVAALTNWRLGTAHRTLRFADTLGLSDASRYVVFDFWNGKLMGSFSGSVGADVGSHDTRVLLIHPDLGRPQVLGTSRHLTSAFSLHNAGWDENARTLSGTSETVAGAPYSLWIRVPAGYRVNHITAALRNEQRQEGELLTLTFDGTGKPVDWKVEFSR